MPPEPYRLAMPARRSTGAVFASPHSGREYPPEFLAATRLDARLIRSSEDFLVDRLFGAAPTCGAPLLAATAPRAFVDVNRAADELDPAVIEGVRAVAFNPRIASGLGVIPRVVANGREIYAGKLTRAEAEARIEAWYRPYHARLRALLDEASAEFGAALLVDCHSMPHEALEGTGPAGAPRPEIVLGDRFGASCAPDVTDAVEAFLIAEGFRVARNAPFAGAYVAQAYGRPRRGVHVIQIEIDRALYMDEKALAPRPEFDTVCASLGRVVAHICDLARGGSGAMPLAAE